MSRTEFSCAGLSKGRHREKTLLNLGAHTSQTDSPCWDSRGTEKRKERERESTKHPPLSDMSPMSGPCQGSLGGKRGNGFFSRARSTQRAPNDVSRYRLAGMDRQCVLRWELIQKTVKRAGGMNNARRLLFRQSLAF